ncbi:unnamed protein product, partial [Callosobruchus maculatus]
EHFPEPHRVVLRDPLTQLSEIQFKKLFRLTKQTFRYVLDRIRVHLDEPVKSTDLYPELMLLTALKFFGSGSYQQDIGYNYCLGISQSSVSRCIHKIIEVFNKQEVMDAFIKFPHTIPELNNIRRQFFLKHNIPGIIGCIDCTHVALFPPKINDPNFPEYLYINRKGYHSINVQLVCDDKLEIMNVCARYPGSNHDSYIWNSCNLKNVLQNLHEAGHTDYFLLGDSGYALRSWLLTPITPEPNPNTPESHYNSAHKRIRSTIERCNGVLKMRFRCLFKHRVLHYDPETACKIINTCCILHNICLRLNDPHFEDHEYDDEDIIDYGVYDNQQADIGELVLNVGRANPLLQVGLRQRSKIVNIFRGRQN